MLSTSDSVFLRLSSLLFICVNGLVKIENHSAIIRAQFITQILRVCWLTNNMYLYLVLGLANTEWPGRNQTVKHGPVTYFLDGAHTIRSMQACVHWFKETATQHDRNARWMSLPHLK